VELAVKHRTNNDDPAREELVRRIHQALVFNEVEGHLSLVALWTDYHETSRLPQLPSGHQARSSRASHARASRQSRMTV
jgi:hypothetical protein